MKKQTGGSTIARESLFIDKPQNLAPKLKRNNTTLEHLIDDRNKVSIPNFDDEEEAV
jgi:hypothetical protein